MNPLALVVRPKVTNELIEGTRPEILSPPPLNHPDIRLKITTLSCAVLSEADVEPIRTALDLWREKCVAMVSAAKDTDLDKSAVEDSREMCWIISEALNSPDFEINDKLLFCSEVDSKRIQGVALINETESFLIVQDIVTNPENIRSPINTSTVEKVRGVGTALIAECGRMALSQGKKGIFLKALRGAKIFYKNCGFTVLDASTSWLPSMFLSSKDMLNSEGSTSKLMIAGASLTPGIPRSKSSSTDTSVSSADTSVSISVVEEEAPIIPSKPKVSQKTSGLIVRALWPLKVSCNTRSQDPSTSLKKSIEKIVAVITCWKKRCDKVLLQLTQKQKNNKVVKLLTTVCDEGLESLKNVHPAKDVVYAFLNKRRDTVQGVAVFTVKKNICVIKSLVVNPFRALVSNALTYEQLIDRVGRVLLSRLGALCEKRGKDGVFIKALEDEEDFFKSLGFENVDDAFNHGRTRMMAATKAITV